MLINVGQQFQLDGRCPQQRIPRETGKCKIVGGIETVRAERGRTEILEYVGEEIDVGLEVQIVVMTKGLTAASRPDLNNRKERRVNEIMHADSNVTHMSKPGSYP